MLATFEVMSTELSELLTSFKEKFELEAPEHVTEEEILSALEARLSVLLQRNPEEFFLTLYMIDIPEQTLHEVLKSSDPVAALARLVYDRQLQKVKSRLYYKAASNNEIDDDLKW